MMNRIFLIALSVLVMSCCRAPGVWRMNQECLVSGGTTEIHVTYRHTGAPMPPGEKYKLRMEALSVKSLFHCIISDDVEILPSGGTMPEVELIRKSVSGIGIMELELGFPSGLKKGDSFMISYGNRTADGIRAIINPFPMKNIVLAAYHSCGDGPYRDWYDSYGAASLARCSIVPDLPSELRIFCPTLSDGNQMKIRMSVTDRFDSRPEKPFRGKVRILDGGGLRGLPEEVLFTGKEDSYVELKNISAPCDGVYRITAEFCGKTFESNPLVVRHDTDYEIYWGTIHNHGEYSEGFGDDNGTVLDLARYSACLDFAALSDHYYQMPSDEDTLGRMDVWTEQCYDTVRHQFMDFFKGRMLKLKYGRDFTILDSWRNTVETADRCNEDGEFVSLCGYEWSSQEAGHYNVYAENMGVENMDKYFLPYYDGFASSLTEHLRHSDALVIPHISAGYFIWADCNTGIRNRDGKLLMPSVESYSDWGDSFSPYDGIPNPGNLTGGMRNPGSLSISEALELGYMFSISGDADSHTGLLGRRVVGGVSPSHDHCAGLTAIFDCDLTRRGVLDAYHERKTYATTGERIFLEFSIDGKPMGQTVANYGEGPCDAVLNVCGTDEISEIRIFDGTETVKVFSPGQRDVSLSFELDNAKKAGERHVYVVEVVQKDGNMAWSSPIWVEPGKTEKGGAVEEVGETPVKFPMPEERVFFTWHNRINDGLATVSFRSGFEYEVKGKFVVHDAEFVCTEQTFWPHMQKIVKVSDNVYEFTVPGRFSLHKMNGFGVFIRPAGPDPRVEFIVGNDVIVENIN